MGKMEFEEAHFLSLCTSDLKYMMQSNHLILLDISIFEKYDLFNAAIYLRNKQSENRRCFPQPMTS